jgi:ankyrin repeat protein
MTSPQIDKDFEMAVRMEDLPEIVRLAAAGADLNRHLTGTAFTPLTWALSACLNAEMAGELLRLGANPNAPGGDGWTTPLMVASEDRLPVAAVKALLDAGANPNAAAGPRRVTVLHLAIMQHARPQAVEFLLKAGANPNAAAADGSTVLHDAVSYNAADAVLELLLNAGADPSVEGPMGTALEIAEFDGNEDAARVLRQATKGGR